MSLFARALTPKRRCACTVHCEWWQRKFNEKDIYSGLTLYATPSLAMHVLLHASPLAEHSPRRVSECHGMQITTHFCSSQEIPSNSITQISHSLRWCLEDPKRKKLHGVRLGDRYVVATQCSWVRSQDLHDHAAQTQTKENFKSFTKLFAEQSPGTEFEWQCITESKMIWYHSLNHLHDLCNIFYRFWEIWDWSWISILKLTLCIRKIDVVNF